MKKIQKKYWLEINDTFVMFGQNICKPISPMCNVCKIKKSCKYYKSKKMWSKLKIIVLYFIISIIFYQRIIFCKVYRNLFHKCLFSYTTNFIFNEQFFLYVYQKKNIM